MRILLIILIVIEIILLIITIVYQQKIKAKFLYPRHWGSGKDKNLFQFIINAFTKSFL